MYISKHMVLIVIIIVMIVATVFCVPGHWPQRFGRLKAHLLFLSSGSLGVCGLQQSKSKVENRAGSETTDTHIVYVSFVHLLFWALGFGFESEHLAHGYREPRLQRRLFATPAAAAEQQQQRV